MTEIKTCAFLSTTTTAPKKRKVTIPWNQSFTQEMEWNLLSLAIQKPLEKDKILISQIQNKRNSYKYQDMEKHKYNAEKFISLSQTLNLLHESHLQCQYCQQTCRLLYDHVRDPCQWSLDRIDNSTGHNEDNVCISCLACNLKRRVTHYPKFLYTKQVVLCKLDT